MTKVNSLVKHDTVKLRKILKNWDKNSVKELPTRSRMLYRIDKD